MMYDGKSPCLCVSGDGVSASYFTGTDDGELLSLSTGAFLNHAGLLNTWCHLSRVTMTHLGPYTS